MCHVNLCAVRTTRGRSLCRTSTVVSLYVYSDCCSAFVDVVGARADVVSGKQPEVVSTNDFCLRHVGFVQRKATILLLVPRDPLLLTSAHIERQQGQGVEHPGPTLVSSFPPRYPAEQYRILNFRIRCSLEKLVTLFVGINKEVILSMESMRFGGASFVSAITSGQCSIFCSVSVLSHTLVVLPNLSRVFCSC